MEYEDHANLWKDELSGWLPDSLFDGHIHLGPSDVIGEIPPQRLIEPVTTFTSLTYEEAMGWYENLYQGRRVVGIVACGFPLREVNIRAANDYILSLAKRDPRVKGFLLANPRDTQQTVREFLAAEAQGTPFVGVKPYYDLLAKDVPHSVLHTKLEEFIPIDLLEFMDARGLPMILHSSGIGMGDRDCQEYVRYIATRFPNVTCMLAHMGRYESVAQFNDFFDSGLMDLPNVYLEMSSATEPKVYERVLRDRSLWPRLIFGSDLPYGLIPGVEYHSEETGPTFISRVEYVWSNPEVNRRFSDLVQRLTYNTYHTIKAFKDAMETLGIIGDDADTLKEGVFRGNIEAIVSRVESR